MAKELDARERKFVDEYMIDGDAPRAAIAAGYSETMANSKAYQWVSNSKVKPHVYAAVRNKQNRISERLEVTAERSIRELARISYGSIRDVAKWGPDGMTLKDSSELTDDQAAMIESITYREGVQGKSVSFKTHSKTTALKMLGDHLGLFKDKTPLELILALLPEPARDAARRAIAGDIQPE